jgi:hypothetical protein
MGRKILERRHKGDDLGKWTEALTDPKLAKKANKKLWERFGYGIEWSSLPAKKTGGSSMTDKKITKQIVKRLSRNFSSDLPNLPVLSQKTLRDIRNPTGSLSESQFKRIFNETEETK